MSTTLLLGYSPITSTTRLVDRRWETDIYHCEPNSGSTGSGRFSQPYHCEGGYGVASMCAFTGRSVRPGWHWGYGYGTGGDRDAYTRGLTTLGRVVDGLRQRQQPKYVYSPSHTETLRFAAEVRAQEICKSTCTARTILRNPQLREIAKRELITKSWSSELDPWAPRKVQREIKEILTCRSIRSNNRKYATRVASEEPGRILRLIPVYAARRAAEKAEKARKRLLAGKLGREALEQLIAAGTYTGDSVSSEADALVRCAVRCVGTIGEQAESDLSLMQTDEEFRGKKGRNHKLERATVERIEYRKDWSAALITMRDYKSFGSSRWGDGGYGSRGGSSFRCYLVVRDTTTGEAHILRVPPKFGNSDTNFFNSFASTVSYGCRWAGDQLQGWNVWCDDTEVNRVVARIVRRHVAADPALVTAGYHNGRTAVIKACEAAAQQIAAERRTHAAVAWTFSREPAAYSPDVEA